MYCHIYADFHQFFLSQITGVRLGMDWGWTGNGLFGALMMSIDWQIVHEENPNGCKAWLWIHNTLSINKAPITHLLYGN